MSHTANSLAPHIGKLVGGNDMGKGFKGKLEKVIESTKSSDFDVAYVKRPKKNTHLIVFCHQIRIVYEHHINIPSKT